MRCKTVCTDCFSFSACQKCSLVSFRCTDYSCFHAVVRGEVYCRKNTEHKLSIRWINIHLQQLSFNEAFITHWSIFMRMKLGPPATVCEIFSINNSLFIFSRGDGDKKSSSRELLSWQLRGRAVINFMVGNFNFSCFSLFCAFFPGFSSFLNLTWVPTTQHMRTNFIARPTTAVDRNSTVWIREKIFENPREQNGSTQWLSGWKMENFHLGKVFFGELTFFFFFSLALLLKFTQKHTQAQPHISFSRHRVIISLCRIRCNLFTRKEKVYYIEETRFFR